MNDEAPKMVETVNSGGSKVIGPGAEKEKKEEDKPKK